MKRIFTVILAILVLCSTFGMFAACNRPIDPIDENTDNGGNGGNIPVAGKASLMAEPAKASALTHTERVSPQAQSIMSAANDFAAKFSQDAFAKFNNGTNFAVAPVSVYMALSLAAQCATGETQQEICTALGLSYEELAESFPLLYRSLVFERRDDAGKVAAMLDVNNSVWLNNGLSVSSDCINDLAQKFFCYPYQADFAGDNDAANRAVREFVKQHTHELIDKNFQLSDQTVFALINVLYLKEVWDNIGSELAFDPRQHTFTDSNGSTSPAQLMLGRYCAGRAVEEENFTHFFTSTANHFKLSFILPKQGHTIEEVFTAQNIARVVATKQYGADDETNKIHYSTRCLFPEFRASFDKDVTPILQQNGINKLFDADLCDFSALTNQPAYCNEVQHVTELKVQQRGIEGAAVTIMTEAGSAAPDEWQNVLEDFVLDRSFGFVLIDSWGTVLFCGVVNSL